eukprot:7565605-Pyramimonas_sp.AAC.1
MGGPDPSAAGSAGDGGDDGAPPPERPAAGSRTSGPMGGASDPDYGARGHNIAPWQQTLIHISKDINVEIERDEMTIVDPEWNR